MKFKILTVLALLVVFVGPAMAQVNVSGSWLLGYTAHPEWGTYSVNLYANGNTFNGTFKNGIKDLCPITDGLVNGNTVGFVEKCRDDVHSTVFAGHFLADGSISGSYIINDGTFKHDGPFTMVRTR